MEASEILKQFNDVWQLRHEYAKDWKRRNKGKVIGCMCTYCPEEIIYAAGMLPVRILGGHEPPTLATPHIFDMWCPFCRDCLNQALKGKYDDYLDGLIEANTCLHLRQAFGAWQLHVPTPWFYWINTPNAVRSPRAKKFYRGELAEFQKALEEMGGKKVTDKDLDKGIEIMNANRELMKKVYEFRKLANPPITGTEAMTMVWASQLMDKREHSELVKQLLEALPKRKLDREAGVRLMIIGSEDDDREFLQMVETLKATFVIEDHCTGSRYFWNNVEPQTDRLQAIADRYLDRIPCPNRDWGMEDVSRKRFPHILQLARDYGVQGAILTQQKFCDPHELDIPSLRRFLEANGIPCYFLEFEVTVPVGQFRIRVEAFIEQIQAEELFV